MNSEKCSITKEEVDAIDDLFEALDKLSEMGIDSKDCDNLEELKILLLSNIETQEKPAEMDHRKFEKILSEDSHRLDQLVSVYNEVEEFLELPSMEEVNSLLQNFFPNFLNKLKEYKSDLENKECHIVITGETSAGKSTIVNLFLGECLLPECVLHSTTIITRVKYGESKSVTLLYADSTSETRSLESDTATCTELLDAYIMKKTPREITITWPIPLIRGHVSIVDTPGISEHDMADRVLQFLPRAAAFIYVVNAANSLQKDRLIDFIRKQMESTVRSKQLMKFDPRCAIFVLNKWDTVPDDPEQAAYVEREIMKALKDVWLNFSPDQCIKMSATEVERCVKSGAGYPKSFLDFWDAVERLIPVSVALNSLTYHSWLAMILNYLNVIIAIPISNAITDRASRHDSLTRMNVRLDKSRNDLKRTKVTLENTISEACTGLAFDLYEYLHSPELVTRFTTWDSKDCQVSGDKQEKMITGRLTGYIHSWFGSSSVQQKLELLLHLLQEVIEKFECLIDDLERDLTALCHMTEIPHILRHPQLNTRSSKLYESVLKTPELFREEFVRQATSEMYIIFSLGTRPLLNLFTNTGDVMAKQSKWLLRSLTVDIMRDKFMEPIVRHWVENEFVRTIEVIEQELDAYGKLVTASLSDDREADSIVAIYLPLHKRCIQLQSTCRLFQRKHFNSEMISLPNLKFGSELGCGLHTTVFNAELDRENGEHQSIAVKIIKGEANIQPLFIPPTDKLRKLDQKNILQFYGFIFKEGTDKTLYVVMELCVSNLRDVVFDSTDKIPADHELSSNEGHDVFLFYICTLRQILTGLAYLHRNNCCHFNLKLTNVLVTSENTVKLSDFGLFRDIEDLLETAEDYTQILHIAPECGFCFFTRTDMFSLGLMMWILWYGRYPYTEVSDGCGAREIFEKVCKGLRPTFQTCQQAPPIELQTLMADCWHFDPFKRTTIEKCLTVIDTSLY